MLVLEIHGVFDGIHVSQNQQPRSIVGNGHISWLSARIHRGYRGQDLRTKVRVGFEQPCRTFFGEDEDRAVGMYGHTLGVMGSVGVAELQPLPRLNGSRKVFNFIQHDDIDRFSIAVVISDIPEEQARATAGARSEAERFRVHWIETCHRDRLGAFALHIRDEEPARIPGVIDVIQTARKLSGGSYAAGLS